MRVPLACLLVALAVGCDDLEEFQTSPSDVFHGVVIGSSDQVAIDDGEEAVAAPSNGRDESFIRQGFDSHTELELTFDPALADTYLVRDAGVGRAPVPGTLNSYLCSTDEQPCAPEHRVQSYFDHAPLETFATLPHDALGQYTFPGGGRIRNYIFGARFTTSGVQRHAMVFLSLMESGKIEVRVLAPSLIVVSGAEAFSEMFGVFSLSKRKQ